MKKVIKYRKSQKIHIAANKCVICGARVRNPNFKTVTCDRTCTEARNAGRTREQQIAYEMANSKDDEQFTYDNLIKEIKMMEND